MLKVDSRLASTHLEIYVSVKKFDEISLKQLLRVGARIRTSQDDYIYGIPIAVPSSGMKLRVTSRCSSPTITTILMAKSSSDSKTSWLCCGIPTVTGTVVVGEVKHNIHV